MPAAERVVKAWLTGKLTADFASPLAWKLVDKRELLERRGTPLSLESTNAQDALETSFTQKKVRDLCDTIAGLWKVPEGVKAVVSCCVIRNTNFTKACRLDLSDVAVLDVEERKLSTRRLLPGDIIIEKSGGGPKQPVGRVVLFPGAPGNWSFSNFCSSLRRKTETEVEASFSIGACATVT